MAKAKKRAPRRKKAAAGSIGLTVAETRNVDSGSVRELTAAVEEDGGAVLGSYRDPFGGTLVLVVSLPINKVEPTPYQRDPSETHIKKLTVIEGRTFPRPARLNPSRPKAIDAEWQPPPVP
jgi:ParB family chromosome partitioning protein